MNILAIESSCDETACAVIRDGTEIVSSVVATSAAMHEKWGGIVPEVAAREQLASIIPVLTETLSQFTDTKIPASRRGENASRGGQRDKDIKKTIENDIDAIAVTVGPGLIGSLLIGVEATKTIAYVCQKPIIPVNHVLAHMYANLLETSQEDSSRAKSRDNIISFPAISLVVSGGHTELYLMNSKKDLKWLGGTIDDAAGEAFDKTARLLGFGSRGGLAIQESAKKYSTMKQPASPNPSRSERSEADRGEFNNVTISLPRPMMHDETLNFSFSGLKTAVMREWKKFESHDEQLVNKFSYEVQEAITDVLVTKTIKAAQQYHAKSILISGGVAANTRLREKFQSNISLSPNLPIHFYCPPIELCTDNAAYIGSYAFFRGIPKDWHDVTAIPDLSVEV